MTAGVSESNGQVVMADIGLCWLLAVKNVCLATNALRQCGTCNRLKAHYDAANYLGYSVQADSTSKPAVDA